MSIVKTKQALQDALGSEYAVLSGTMGYRMPSHDQVFRFDISHAGETRAVEEIVPAPDSINAAMTRLADRIKKGKS